MTDQDKFDSVYESMRYNSEKIDGLISYLDQLLQQNPSDDIIKEISSSVATIARNMDFTQKEFAKLYADLTVRDGLISRIDSKEQRIIEFLDRINKKTL